MMNNTILVTAIEKLQKGKYNITLDNGECFLMYGYEMRGLNLKEGVSVSADTRQLIIKDIIGKRAKKRALHLLEKMDRTEYQLRDKLVASDYPTECIDDAIAYVKSFHYLDDERYAETFTRYQKEKLSRGQIKQKLMTKGVSRDIIENVIEDEYDVDEVVHIRRLLDKKHFQDNYADEGERRRVYNYLLRRGFRSNDILKEMKCVGEDC